MLGTNRPMVRDRKPMRFVANSLKQFPCLGAFRQRDRIRLSRQEDLLALLGETQYRDIVQRQVCQHFQHGIELSLAAIDYEQVGFHTP